MNYCLIVVPSPAESKYFFYPANDIDVAASIFSKIMCQHFGEIDLESYLAWAGGDYYYDYQEPNTGISFYNNVWCDAGC